MNASTPRPHDSAPDPVSFLRRPLLVGGVALTAAVTLAACGSTPATSTSTPSKPTAAAEPSHDGMHGGDAMSGMGGHSRDPGRGLLTTEDGYTLRPTSNALRTGPQTVSFKILDPQGTPQTDYTPDQTKLLHFYLVREDLSGYQHLHPTLTTGTWSIPLTVAAPGRYRMYADFIAKDSGGKDHPVVLSTVLTAPGQVTPVAIAPPTTSVTAEGLTATIDGTAAAGKSSNLTVTITSNGKPVDDLQPYLDTYAHMTALHVGDLTYEHVHPELTAQPGKTGGPSLPFSIELPEPGTWKLFLQVQRQGALHLLPLTVNVA